MNKSTIAKITLVSFLTLAGNHSSYATGQNEVEQYSPSAEDIVVDGLIVRPLTFAGTIVGAGVFLVTLPFSVVGGNVGEVGKKLVADPASITFNRSLGDFGGFRRYNRYQRYSRYRGYHGYHGYAGHRRYWGHRGYHRYHY